ncbi:MAG: methyltransferase domain-containing protein [Actinomycetes bacterium]
MSLPNWRDHEGHKKLLPLTVPGPEQSDVERFVSLACEHSGRSRGSFRVLDMGCGRGSLVARLQSLGFDAWGADVAAEYVGAGLDYFSKIDAGVNRLAVIDSDGLPFEEPFDAIISTETLEHVADLGQFAAQLDQVSKPGTVGMHRWPAKYRVEESHMNLPVVHWLPKGSARKTLIKAELGLGMGVDYFKDLPLADRTEIFNRYSNDETYYRTLREIRRTFSTHGMDCDFLGIATARFREKFPWAPNVLARSGAIVSANLRAGQMTTVHK